MTFVKLIPIFFLAVMAPMSFLSIVEHGYTHVKMMALSFDLLFPFFIWWYVNLLETKTFGPRWEVWNEPNGVKIMIRATKEERQKLSVGAKKIFTFRARTQADAFGVCASYLVG